MVSMTLTPPSWAVQVPVRSVPQRRSGASGMIVPSWLRGPRGLPLRLGARRPCSRIKRSTRARLVRIPRWRSFAHTLRYPSPKNAVAVSTRRICSTSSASLCLPTGPRAGRGSGGGLFSVCLDQYTLERATPATRHTDFSATTCFREIDTLRLTSSISLALKGRVSSRTPG